MHATHEIVPVDSLATEAALEDFVRVALVCARVEHEGVPDQQDVEGWRREGHSAGITVDGLGPLEEPRGGGPAEEVPCLAAHEALFAPVMVHGFLEVYEGVEKLEVDGALRHGRKTFGMDGGLGDELILCWHRYQGGRSQGKVVD